MLRIGYRLSSIGRRPASGSCRCSMRLTLFVSALLLFSIQPMFAKMVLPKLGGAPAVWSVAMVFFQTALLAGYAYAHLLNRLLLPRRAAMFHLVLVGVTAMTLPIADCAGMGAPPSDGRRSGCSDCLRSPSAFRSSRCRPARRCCKAGLPRAGTGRRAIPTCSTPHPISVRLPRCSPIPSSSNRS